jgi:hypothetical protein
MAKSKFFTLNARDFFRGLIVAVGTAIGTGVAAILKTGQIPDSSDMQTIGTAGAAAGVAYLTKNLFTNSDDNFAKAEPKK